MKSLWPRQTYLFYVTKTKSHMEKLIFIWTLNCGWEQFLLAWMKMWSHPFSSSCLSSLYCLDSQSISIAIPVNPCYSHCLKESWCYGMLPVRSCFLSSFPIPSGRPSPLTATQCYSSFRAFRLILNRLKLNWETNIKWHKSICAGIYSD